MSKDVAEGFDVFSLVVALGGEILLLMPAFWEYLL
jgi:hypothetical protein